MPNAIERVVSTIFCDDIRQEIGSKLSFMGVYQGSLIVQGVPAVLPKFCVFASIRTPIDKPFSKLTVRLLKDDEVFYEQPMEVGPVPPESKLPGEPPTDASGRLQFYAAVMSFSPFLIEKPFILRVRVLADDIEIRGPGLMIAIQPNV
jgi:hypothetical protein